MSRPSCVAPAWRALFVTAAVLPSAVHAEDAPAADIVVTAERIRDIAAAPNSRASVDAGTIADTVNAVNVEDSLKYLPSLVIRKRHIGDTQSPLATRTSGLGASARSLIYADGALLSALIGNNNTTASPRWGLVSPDEIARIDVLYGPFSAAYPGNSIGAVVDITTRMPDALEGTLSATESIQRFRQYGTSETLPTGQFGATLGDRIGPLSFFLSAVQTTSNSQPLAYVTAVRGAPGGAGTPTSGGFDDVNRLGQPIRVLGAGGFEHQQQQSFKAKARLDLGGVAVTYVGGLFLNDTDASAETYLSNAAGQPVYAGTLNIAGIPYTVAPSAFANNVYRYDERHWSHSLSATGAGDRFDWQVIGTLYDFAKDVQRVPSTLGGYALNSDSPGGPGNATRLDGTGWYTLDAKARWQVADNHTLSFGVHRDRFELNSNRYALAEWTHGPEGALNLASRGKTRTDGIWLQDAWTLAEPLTLTVGGRYEWWTAYDGFNFSAAPVLSVNQPRRSNERFSPKASLRFAPSGPWSVTASFGEAWRFPTVTELYQTVTTGPSITVPNPNLKPERALSEELAIERRDEHGSIRLSLFNEAIRDALLSQTAVLVPGSSTLFSYVQNVDRVRTRGVELAVVQTDILPGFDLSGSVTLVDPKIRADAALPAAIGKRPPQVPRRKATVVATYRPNPQIALTAAARYSSRSFGTIDNSDPVSNTYQGFAKYLVVDLRANFRVTPHWELAVGVDNVNNDKYFLFHPFPQRSFVAELKYRL